MGLGQKNRHARRHDSTVVLTAAQQFVELEEQVRVLPLGFKMKIIILDEHGGFTIVVNDKRFHFDDDDGHHQGLVEVFKALGIEDVSHEEVC